ncbi:hypothetical protein BKP42_63260 [Rhodococcus erythropolis]|nr:hypothetical protein BKP42_63260 [Rhodococcus erythropolis]
MLLFAAFATPLRCVERHHYDDGAEGLLLNDAELGLHVHEYRRRVRRPGSR